MKEPIFMEVCRKFRKAADYFMKPWTTGMEVIAGDLRSTAGEQ